MPRRHLQPIQNGESGAEVRGRTKLPEVEQKKVEASKEYPKRETPASEDQGRKASSVSSPVPKHGGEAILELTHEVDEELKMIENILQEGLEEVYQRMPVDKQREFRDKGEETARNIQIMIATMKLKTQRIIHWIMEWLKVIPGVSKLFLHQEAKLKTDKILEHLKERRADEGNSEQTRKD